MYKIYRHYFIIEFIVGNTIIKCVVGYFTIKMYHWDFIIKYIVGNPTIKMYC